MEKKEMSMETRLLIFFVLMGLVLLGTQYFYKPPPQPAKPTAAVPATTPAEKLWNTKRSPTRSPAPPPKPRRLSFHPSICPAA